MRLYQNFPISADDSDGDDLNGTNRRSGVGERGFAFRDLEPEVMDVLGAGLDTPGREGVRRQTGLEPLRERLWRDEEVVATREQIDLMIRCRVGHGGNFEKTTRVQRER